MVDPGASSVHPTTVPLPLQTSVVSTPTVLPRREALLRGPLILTAISRVLLTPLYLLCAWGASNDARKLLPHWHDYLSLYLADKILLAVGLWSLALLSVLLAWLFFSRRRMFRPMMVYFGCLFPLLLVGLIAHAVRFPAHPHRPPPDGALFHWFTGMTLAYVFSSLLWPFYYAFSPRVKKVFTR